MWPSVPFCEGATSQGRTKRALIKNIREAIDAYIEALIKDGLPVPTERGHVTVEIEVRAR